jgi:tetratricopeptide (TPR) repeat protein/transcriptional regulator with XRE-family HTH domain
MDTINRKPNDLLHRERKLRCWTLEQVADALDKLCQEEPRARRRDGMINESMVSRWERGIHPPSPFYQRMLCKLFDKSAEALGFVDPLPNQETELLSLPPHLHLTSGPSNMQQVLPAQLSTTQAIDLLCSNGENGTSDQQLGAWLALSAQNLTPLFDEGWTPQMALEALHVLLPGVHAMSLISRRTFGHRLLQLGAAAFLSGVPMAAEKNISAQERVHLHQALGESIAAGWNLFHTADNAQVLAVGQAELALVQQAHAILYPQLRSLYYTGVYNLIGRAYHLREQYDEALQAHMSAHIAALGAGNPLPVAQSLICQADTYQALGQYGNAIQCIEEALRTLGHHDEEHVRSRAHLLACWADNAMTVGEFTVAEHKLEEAEVYLDQIGPKEEFDRASWLQLAGKRAIMAGEYKRAIPYLEEARAISPFHWLVRRAGILIPLAIAHARMGERDLSIQIAQQAVPVLIALNAPMSNKHFADYLQQDLFGFFPRDEQIHTFVSEVQHQLPQIAALIG